MGSKRLEATVRVPGFIPPSYTIAQANHKGIFTILINLSFPTNGPSVIIISAMLI